MAQYLAHIAMALLAAMAVWALILFLMSPELMGPMAPSAALALRRAFKKPRQIPYETVGRRVRNVALATAAFSAPVEYSLATPPSYYFIQADMTAAATDVSRSVR